MALTHANGSRVQLEGFGDVETDELLAFVEEDCMINGCAATVVSRQQTQRN